LEEREREGLKKEKERSGNWGGVGIEGLSFIHDTNPPNFGKL